MTPLPPITCQVASVHDGDTFRCVGGTLIRIAGVDANELDGSCHMVCAPMPSRQARAWLDRLIYRRRLTCQPVGMSYRRVVARCAVNGVDLSCASIAAGAAVRWERYWVAYRMGVCRG